MKLGNDDFEFSPMRERESIDMKIHFLETALKLEEVFVVVDFTLFDSMVDFTLFEADFTLFVSSYSAFGLV